MSCSPPRACARSCARDAPVDPEDLVAASDHLPVWADVTIGPPPPVVVGLPG